MHPRDPGAASHSHRAALDLQSSSVPGINYRLCRSCLQPPLYNLSSCFASPLQEPLVNPKSSTCDCPGGPSPGREPGWCCPARGQGCGAAGTTSTWQCTKTAKRGMSRGKPAVDLGLRGDLSRGKCPCPWQGWSLRSLPTKSIPWFCDSKGCLPWCHSALSTTSHPSPAAWTTPAPHHAGFSVVPHHRHSQYPQYCPSPPAPTRTPLGCSEEGPALSLLRVVPGRSGGQCLPSAGLSAPCAPLHHAQLSVPTAPVLVGFKS